MIEYVIVSLEHRFKLVVAIICIIAVILLCLTVRFNWLFGVTMAVCFVAVICLFCGLVALIVSIRTKESR